MHLPGVRRPFGAMVRPVSSRIRVQLALQRAVQLVVLASVVLASAGCGGEKGPRPLVVGEDSCDFCKMAISDPRFGAEVRTTTGRLVTFDAVECVAGYVGAATDKSRIAGIWVADYHGGAMVPADSALFVSGGSLHSPMGRQLTSFAPSISADSLATLYGGTVIRWAEVLAMAPTPPHGSSHVPPSGEPSGGSPSTGNAPSDETTPTHEH
ncbi:MAG: nitrous oxide reductase accessory protein NosL [Gemmatimonadaceae bacterium]|nr:nitrous oxide reductase accessory protein NosL [Gemmatimonadaceae bacterium]